MKLLQTASRWFRSLQQPRTRPARQGRVRMLAIEELESRLVPATIPIYFNAPADVVSQGVSVAITGKDPNSSPVDQGMYFQFGPPANGAYSGTYSDLSISTPTIPLQQLSFQSGTPPAGDTNVPSGYSWVEVDLPGSLVDSGQIIMFVGSNAPQSLPVVSSGQFYDVSAPSPTTYPNNMFGLFEYSVVRNTSGTISFIDSSNVDSIGVPFTVQTNPLSNAIPTQQGVGIQLTGAALQNQFPSFLTTQASSSPGAAGFQQLLSLATIPECHRL